ncbi:hypothetical protein [Kibdelosporangium philippinense]
MADCERGVEKWKLGQVVYPKTFAMELGVSAVYVAAVDIRDIPAPPSQLVSAPEVRSEAIAVKCVLSARIVVDPSMQVDNPNWVSRQFNPVGSLNWSWHVSATQPGSRELRLELQPAVVDRSGLQLATGSAWETSTFVTKVEVNASAPQRFGQWWSDNWPVLLLVAGGIGAAVLGFVKWTGRLGKEVRSARKSWRNH